LCVCVGCVCVWCVCVCVVCVCMCVVCVCVWVCVGVCMCVYCVCGVYVYVCVCGCVYVCMCVCRCMCVSIACARARVALANGHAMRMRRVVICSLFGSTIFVHNLINSTNFGGKKKVTEHKIRVLIFSPTFVWNISYSKKDLARYDKKKSNDLPVKYPLFLSDFNETWIIPTDFRKNSRM